MRFIVFVLGFLLTIVGAFAINVTDENRAYAESRITNTSDTYVINWTTDGREYTTREVGLGIRRVGNSTFWTIELDPHMAQLIRVIDVDEFGQFTKIGLTLLENPNDPYNSSTVPLRACVNTTKVIGGRRFEVENTFCNVGSTQYYLDRIPFNAEFIVRFSDHPRPYVWWLGELDPDGTYGQGGGGDGLPTCDFMTTQITAPNNVTVGVPFSYGQIGLINVNPSVGCTIVWFRRQSNTTSPTTFALIPTTSTGINMNCTGVSCQDTAPAVQTWYYRNVTCEKEGDQFIRGRMRYAYPGGLTNVNGLTKKVTCNAPVAPASGDGGAWWIYFIPFAIFGGSYFLVMRQNDKHEENEERQRHN